MCVGIAHTVHEVIAQPAGHGRLARPPHVRRGWRQGSHVVSNMIRGERLQPSGECVWLHHVRRARLACRAPHTHVRHNHSRPKWRAPAIVGEEGILTLRLAARRRAP